MIDLSHIKLLVVDLDNTLCDTYHTLTIRQWLFVADGFEKKGRLDVAKALRRHAGKQSFVSMLETLPLNQTEKTYAVRLYDKNPVASLRLFADAHEILRLQKKKVLLTRGEPALQRRKIKHLNIRKYFDDIVIIKTFETKEQALRDIARKHRLNPSQILVIGDRMEEEIETAHKLGMPTVLVRRPGWPVRKSKIIPTLTVRKLEVLARRLQ